MYPIVLSGILPENAGGYMVHGRLYNNPEKFIERIFDKNVDLEIDGSQHKLVERIESDKVRSEALINNGFIVYRIEWKNINTEKGKEYIKNEIDKFLKFIGK